MDKFPPSRADIVTRLLSNSHQLETQPLSVNLVSTFLTRIADELDPFRALAAAASHERSSFPLIPRCFEARCARIIAELRVQSRRLPGRCHFAPRGAVIVEILAVQVGRLSVFNCAAAGDGYAEKMDRVADAKDREWRDRCLYEDEEVERWVRQGHELWVRLDAAVEGCECWQCGRRRVRDMFVFE